MDGTERPRRLRPPLVLPAVLLVAVGAVLVGGADDGRAPALPAPPEPSRPDITVEVDAERADGGLRLVVDVRLEHGADELALVDWSPGDHPRWPDGDPFVVRWSPTVRGERLPDGQVVLHLGHGSPQGDETDRMQPLRSRVREIVPGRTAEARFPFDPDVWAPAEDEPAPVAGSDLDRIDEVRVCVWDADDDPAAPGAHPVGCADDRL